VWSLLARWRRRRIRRTGEVVVVGFMQREMAELKFVRGELLVLFVLHSLVSCARTFF